MVAAVLFAASFPSIPHRQPITYTQFSLLCSYFFLFFPFRSISLFSISLVFSDTSEVALLMASVLAATIAYCSFVLYSTTEYKFGASLHPKVDEKLFSRFHFSSAFGFATHASV